MFFKKKLPVLSFIVICLLTGAGRQGVATIDFFPHHVKKAIVSGEIVSRTTVYGKTVVNRGINEAVKPPVFSFLPGNVGGYEILAEERAFFPLKNGISQRKKLLAVLTSFDKLKGMKYYSAGDRGSRVLILDSKKLPPENKTNVQGQRNSFLSYCFRLRDNRFGWQTFRADVYRGGNTVTLYNRSLLPMKRFGALINRAGESLMVYRFRYDPRLRGFLFYGFHAMRVRSFYLKGIGIPSPVSMANRLRANTVFLASSFGLNWHNKLKAFP